MIGACTGEVEVLFSRETLEGLYHTLLTASQYIEYKLSFNIGKGAESLFGFVSVLPGAFTTIRWDAISGAPLRQFFHNIHKPYLSCFDANMQLAEDKMICIEILTKVGESWLIKYISFLYPS